MEDDDIIFVFFCEFVISCIIYILRKKRNRRERNKAPFSQRGLYKIFLESDERIFKKMVRLSHSEFEYVLQEIKDVITNYRRDSVPPDLKLLITLHFLAHGSTKVKTAIDFELGEATITTILDEVCDAIIHILGPKFLSYPTQDEWVDIEKGFWRRWNVPNMLGAIDGKHFRVKKPAKSVTNDFNNKGFFSVPIMAVVDYRYKFSVIELGDHGSDNDGGFLKETKFGRALYERKDEERWQKLRWPRPKKIPGTEQLVPHFLVGDGAFQLFDSLMKPYPGSRLPQNKLIFNYRMSRARQVVENAFGILAARWRIFQTAMSASPDRSKKYIYTSIVLHNMLCEISAEYVPDDFADQHVGADVIPGTFRQQVYNSNMTDMSPSLIRNSPRSAGEIRNILTEFFTTEAGRLSWQEDYVNRGSLSR